MSNSRSLDSTSVGVGKLVEDYGFGNIDVMTIKHAVGKGREV